VERSLRQLDPHVHFTQEATLDALGQTLARPRIEALLGAQGVLEQRTRKLTMVLAVLVCVAMNLFTEDAIEEVLFKLLQGPRFLRPADELHAASASAICQRRQQLGVAPMVALFHEVCRPLATSQTRDAFLCGLRLMAIDGTKEDIPDTAANADYFGRHRGPRGASAFPQVTAVYLCECGTHAICDAGFWPEQVSERVGGLRLLRSVGPGMLVMWDRGFHSYDMCARCRRQGAHFLARLPAHVQVNPLRQLSDGSYLAELTPSEYQRRKGGERLAVRVIEYTLDDPTRPGHGERHRVITSLVDEVTYPAHTLACGYHERWEVELTIDETDTHQRQPRQPLRSRTPVGVLQELYGLLMAHYAIRAVMHNAALRADVAPDRLSFVHTLRLIRTAVFEFQIIAEAQNAAWYERLLREISREQLPIRENRSNPRVVKRKMSNFRLKRDGHRHWPQPSKSFAEAVVIVI
jgi:Insertion element 4 transposase N-terminal/Transposase DDE domain